MSYFNINRIDIPVIDIDRAIKFYSQVFKFKFSILDLDELQMAIPEKSGSVAVALVKHPEFYFASDSKGPLIYIKSNTEDCANELSAVEAAGGKVLIQKRLISENVGYMGLFIDSEGNRMGIHSEK